MKNIAKLIKKGKLRLDGKKVAVSGSTGGIGRELARYLAAMGAELLLLDRNEEKAQKLINELKASFPSLSASHIRLDLENVEEVRLVAQKLPDMGIDYLILNAGAYGIQRRKCSSGYDNVFMINCLSPYVLAKALLPGIKERNGRVVVVGSIAHDYSKADFDDVDFSSRKQASKAYGNAKRYLMFSAYALGEEFEGCVSVTHPGITQTNITAHYPKIVYALIKYPMRVIFMRPKKACLSILCGIFESCDRNFWIGPRIFNIWGLPKKKRLNTCSSEEAEKIAQTVKEASETI